MQSVNRALKVGNSRWDFGAGTLVMGILNVTPDSFSDGGKYGDLDAALAQARRMVEEGADIIDVGGESTRPGHTPVDAEDEARRVIPVVRRLAPELPVPLSVDTSKADVAHLAVEAGAGMINDVSGLRADPEMASVVAHFGVPVVIMHDRKVDAGPGLMDEINRWLAESIDIALKAGAAEENIVVDPGFGFGKDVAGNLQILRELRRMQALGRPILLGTSRKSTIGKVLDLPVDQRVEGTAATVAIGIANGADIVRVHDVRAMVRVARMADAIVRGFTSAADAGRFDKRGEITSGMPDRISLKGMVFYGYHGAYPAEQELGQRFEVDLEVSLDLGPAGRTDDLSLGLDYSKLYLGVKDIVEGRRFKLIEALAEAIASFTLQFQPVGEATVRVRKPQAPLQGVFGTVEVEINRSRG